MRQGPYLNCVAELQTGLSPYELLKALHKIEADLGRRRTVKNASREIDLDILLYGNLRLNDSTLSIPHPRMLKRHFVMKPLEEIAPETAKNLRRNFKELSN